MRHLRGKPSAISMSSRCKDAAKPSQNLQKMRHKHLKFLQLWSLSHRHLTRKAIRCYKEVMHANLTNQARFQACWARQLTTCQSLERRTSRSTPKRIAFRHFQRQNYKVQICQTLLKLMKSVSMHLKLESTCLKAYSMALSQSSESTNRSKRVVVRRSLCQIVPSHQS